MRTLLGVLAVLIFAAPAVFAADNLALTVLPTDDATFAPADARGILTGKYIGTENKKLRLIIDENDRIIHNTMAIVNGVTGEKSPLHFPHQLKKDEFENFYFTEGYFQMTVHNGSLVRVCEYRAVLRAETVNPSQGLDVTLKFPAGAFIDSWGRCGATGQAQSLMGYNRVD